MRARHSWNGGEREMAEGAAQERPYTAWRLAGMAIGPVCALVLLALPAPADLTPAAWATAAVAVWMAVWWASEAVPLAATGLLPLVLFPLLGIYDIGKAAAPFANPLIFLFLGGFLIALAMQRWSLHRRIALHIATRAGSRPTALMAGIMAATALLSMWISNTATAMMMMPIAASLAAIVRSGASTAPEADDTRFATALMLATAYSASIGGLATLVGSPPNALLAAFMAQTYQVEVGFAHWMSIGLPVTVLMLPLTWLVLTKLVFRIDLDERADAAQVIADELRSMGPMTRPEKRVATVFACVAILWMTNPLLGAWIGPGAISDTAIAIAGAVLLFVIPADWQARVFLLDWRWARRAPWDILLLFGGGLSLAQAVDTTGLAVWIGGGLAAFGAWPVFLLVAAVAGLTIFLTELTSNTATTAAFLPVVAAVAVQAELAPLLLTVPAALAASCAFMLPVATPPNAIVFGSGYVTIPQMMRAGLVLNVLGIVVLTGLTAVILTRVFS